MISIEQHVAMLAKHCTCSPKEIEDCIWKNRLVMDTDSLLSYSLKEQSNGMAMTVLFASGDGPKIEGWMLEEANKFNCKSIYCVTQRPRAMGKKYKFKPVGTLMEREV